MVNKGYESVTVTPYGGEPRTLLISKRNPSFLEKTRIATNVAGSSIKSQGYRSDVIEWISEIIRRSAIWEDGNPTPNDQDMAEYIMELPDEDVGRVFEVVGRYHGLESFLAIYERGIRKQRKKG